MISSVKTKRLVSLSFLQRLKLRYDAMPMIFKDKGSRWWHAYGDDAILFALLTDDNGSLWVPFAFHGLGVFLISDEDKEVRIQTVIERTGRNVMCFRETER